MAQADGTASASRSQAPGGVFVADIDKTPVPMMAAIELLKKSLRHPGLKGHAACIAEGWKVLRSEVSLAAPGPQARYGLDFISSQRQFPRALFAGRDGSRLHAGVGAALEYRKGNPQRLLLGAKADSRIRFIGGTRFDKATESKSREWQRFGGSYWMLPRIEVAVINEAAESARSTGSQGSSTAPTAVFGARQGEGRMLENAVLAVQLCWKEDSENSFEEELAKALQALERLRPIEPQNRPIAIVSKKDTVKQEAFEAEVQRALEAFTRHELTKVVLARRKEMILDRREDAPEILRQVVLGASGSHNKQYLFVLEPEEGFAFMSASPERLCKVQGNIIYTEAVAGTWPIEVYNAYKNVGEGEKELLKSSEKHTGEHEFVMNSLRSLFNSVPELVGELKVSDKHILKLRNLVHIKVSYHSTMNEGIELHRLIDWFLAAVSPTPAVCGEPTEKAKEFIEQAEPWDRGYFAAPCGIISSSDTELIVAIRSALLEEGQTLYAYAGAGIVKGSDPKEEHDEISLKMSQFTEVSQKTVRKVTISWLQEQLTLNMLWTTCLVEELIRCNVCNFVICPGSRSTPIVVAIQRSNRTRWVVNHDERSGAYQALGWAKGSNLPVAIVVTSGTAVANLLPAAVEASMSQIPLLMLTADRPAELRDTGSNQTIRQTGIFSSQIRWEKDFPPPSVEYPLAALIGDVDLGVAHSKGLLTSHPGPVHLNFCFRENLAPKAGPVRGSPGLTTEWPKAYLDSPVLHHWAASSSPRSSYIPPTCLATGAVLEALEAAVSRDARILVMVGTLSTPTDVLNVEDIAARLGALVFADITSGLRQRPGTVHYSEKLLNSTLLSAQSLQVDVIVQIGGPMVSRGHMGFVKAGAPLYVRVAPGPVRMDQDWVVTHHLMCGPAALCQALAKASLPRKPPSAFWTRLSNVVEQTIETSLGDSFSEPLLARTLSHIMPSGQRLLISSSMPIRDLDNFAKPCTDVSQAPLHPPMSNRGASGIDGVISTAVGLCRASEVPCTLPIGDVSTIQDFQALQLLSEKDPNAPPLIVIIVNNGGGMIFSFLPIAEFKDVMDPFFNEPHCTDFESACKTWHVPYALCTDITTFKAVYEKATATEEKPKGMVIEVQPSSTFDKGNSEENIDLHKQINKAVSLAVQNELVTEVPIEFCQWREGHHNFVVVFLHGWLGQKEDWKAVCRDLEKEGISYVALDLPGFEGPDAWEAAVLNSQSVVAEAVKATLDNLDVEKPILAGYSAGGRVAMEIDQRYPEFCSALMVLSANPGLRSTEERRVRWKEDQKMAKELRQVHEEKLKWLETWYSKKLWADLKSADEGRVYTKMLEKRNENFCPAIAANSLLGLSVAHQADFRPALRKTGRPFWYVHGEKDEKYAKIGQELVSSEICSEDQVHSLPCGHAVVEECPVKVAHLVEKLVRLLA